MRRKLHTRFPATRIKKIMQSDEDIGKIALAVPVLVSKALELFLQDLCGKTYSMTLHRGVKTMSSFHLKQCVHKFTVFDFLKDLVSKVPDVGGSYADPDDKATKKRKAADEDNYSEEETKRSNNEACRNSSNRSRRGQGRCHGKGRGSLVVDGVEKCSADFNIYEDDPGTLQHDDERDMATASEENCVTSSSVRATVGNFDLNLDFNDIEEIAPASATTAAAMATIFKMKRKRIMTSYKDDHFAFVFLAYRKQCVHKFTVFDFLKDLVSKVPDVGGSYADPDDKATKKRKAADEDNYSEEETKRSNNEACRNSSNRSRRGQGRCHGKGRGSLVVDGVEKCSADFNIYEDDPGTLQHDDERDMATASEENCVTSSSVRATVGNFDLNLDFNDIEEIAPASATTAAAMATIFKVNHDLTNDYLGSSISNMDKITIDPVQYALSHRRLDEEEEDYDIVQG
ncbi:hypothetical protein C4D60_Mb04t00240 [Musa balbisiana]|uniref:Transcription factor CBF/NF-Y/archaeal histone domain-containing protein n=1 Tax=Musa balbisiana TaxID=52838 RepID=A0A4S8K8L5_MUSBA|nr:hypothetical protein C4D60_Mb04t00240 [Musa balbisiana]